MLKYVTYIYSMYWFDTNQLIPILFDIHFHNSRQKYVLTQNTTALMDDVSIFDATVSWWEKENLTLSIFWHSFLRNQLFLSWFWTLVVLEQKTLCMYTFFQIWHKSTKLVFDAKHRWKNVSWHQFSISIMYALDFCGNIHQYKVWSQHENLQRMGFRWTHPAYCNWEKFHCGIRLHPIM